MKKISIYIVVLFVVSVGCKKTEEITKKDDLVGGWNLSEFEFKIFEGGALTQNFSANASSKYLGELIVKEEGLYESNIVNHLPEAYYLYGYSDNAYQDGIGSRGVWHRANDSKLQFDKGLPELLADVDNPEGHLVDFTITDDKLTINPSNEAQYQYYGYFNGKFSNTPSNFSPNASSVVKASNSQPDTADIGLYYGYYLGFYKGQADRLATLGGDTTEPYWYGLLLGTIDEIERGYNVYKNDPQAIAGYNTAYPSQFLLGKTYADSVFASPAKTYSLKFVYKRQ